MARKREMTVGIQIERIAEAIRRDFPNHETVNFYFVRFDRPMRVTIRDKMSGDVLLRELGPDYRSLKKVA